MHPVEHLRHVARARGVPAATIVREAALAVGSYRDDPAALVTACRRLVARAGDDALLWWFCARVLTDPDPGRAAADAIEELDADDTAMVLADALPDGSTVTVLGWPAQTAAALARRGDLSVLVVDVLGDGHDLVRALEGCDVDAAGAPESGLGAAVVDADVVLLEGSAASASETLAVSGSLAAAAVARHAGVAVWLTLGCGRLLPESLYDALVQARGPGEAYHDDVEPVSLELVDRIARPDGVVSVAEAIRSPDCPVAAELS